MTWKEILPSPWAVKELLRDKTEVEAQELNAITALYVVVYVWQSDIIRLFLKEDPDIKA